MKFTLANTLTLFRMIISIPYIIIMGFILHNNKSSKSFVYDNIDIYMILFLILFSLFFIAMITDFLDGYIARKKNEVTNFGKLFDPIADKIIINSTLIFFTMIDVVPFWITIIFIVRDIIVNGMRNLAAKNQKKVDASIWGKIKTLFQTFSICLIFTVTPFLEQHNEYESNKNILLIPLIISLVFSLYSGINYFFKITDLLKKDFLKK